MRALDTFSPSQIPQFLLRDLPRDSGAEYPIFVEFIQKYYEFLRDYTADIEQIRNVAATPEALLEYFRRELAAGFDTSKARIDERRFLEFTKAIYRRKGTIGGLELLFRLFYGETIQVFEPYKQVLKASDGKWFQEKSILVKKTYNSPDYLSVTGTPIVELKSPDGSIFNLKTLRVENLSSGSSTRFFFRNYTRVIAEVGTIVTIYDSTKILYRGEVQREPARLKVLNPGKYWRRGQVFRVPGTVDTIARVVSVDENGGIDGAEIIKFGKGHPSNQVVTVSPFRNKPYGSFSVDSIVIGYTPGIGAIYHHEVGLSDEILQIDESVKGYETPDDIDKYDSQVYFETDYMSTLALDYVVSFGSSSSLPEDPYLTLETWLASRATLLYEEDYIVSYLGRYETADGQLSNDAVRLHDGFYYQLFSYVVSSALGVEKYRDTLSLVHPAGTKFFAELQQHSIYTATLSGDASLADNYLIFDESADAQDDYKQIHVGKPLEDFITEVSDNSWSFGVGFGGYDAVYTEDTMGQFYAGEDFFGEEYSRSASLLASI